MWKFVFHAHLRANCILFALFLSLRFLLILLRNPKRFYCWSNFPKKEIKFAQHTINMQFNLLKNLIWILFSSHFSFIVMHNLKSRCFEPKVYFLAVGCVCVTHLHLFRSSFAENDFLSHYTGMYLYTYYATMAFKVWTIFFSFSIFSVENSLNFRSIQIWMQGELLDKKKLRKLCSG